MPCLGGRGREVLLSGVRVACACIIIAAWTKLPLVCQTSLAASVLVRLVTHTPGENHLGARVKHESQEFSAR